MCFLPLLEHPLMFFVMASRRKRPLKSDMYMLCYTRTSKKRDSCFSLETL